MQLDSTTRDAEYENAEAQAEKVNDRLQMLCMDGFLGCDPDPEHPGEIAFHHDGEEFARLHWSEAKCGLVKVVARLFARTLEKL